MDHIHCQNDILKISESTAKATVETEQEIFGAEHYLSCCYILLTGSR